IFLARVLSRSRSSIARNTTSCSKTSPRSLMLTFCWSFQTSASDTRSIAPAMTIDMIPWRAKRLRFFGERQRDQRYPIARLLGPALQIEPGHFPTKCTPGRPALVMVRQEVKPAMAIGRTRAFIGQSLLAVGNPAAQRDERGIGKAVVTQGTPKQPDSYEGFFRAIAEAGHAIAKPG